MGQRSKRAYMRLKEKPLTAADSLRMRDPFGGPSKYCEMKGVMML